MHPTRSPSAACSEAFAVRCTLFRTVTKKNKGGLSTRLSQLDLSATQNKPYRTEADNTCQGGGL